MEPHDDLLDHGMLEREFLHHKAFLENLALKLMDDRSDAEDLLQELWLLLLRRPPEGVLSWRAWLSTVMRNLAANMKRGMGRRRRREEISAQPEGVLPTTQQILDREQLRRRLLDAIASLGEPYSSVLLYRYYEELTPVEIATKLGVPLDTVKTRLRRGRTLLRAQLDQEFGDRDTWCLFLLAAARPSDAAVAASATATTAATAIVTSSGIGVVLTMVLFGFVWWWGLPSLPQPPSSLSATPPVQTDPHAAVVASAVDESRSAASRHSPTTDLVDWRLRFIEGATGSAIPDIRLTLHPFDHPERELASTRTDASGVVRLRVRRGLRLRGRIRGKGWVPLDIPLYFSQSCEAAIHLDRGIDAAVQLLDTEGRPIPKQVVYQLNHARLEQHELQPIWRAETSTRMITDSQGWLRTTYRNPHTLLVVREGAFVPEVRELLQASVAATAAWHLTRGRPLRGRVVDRSGHAMAGVSLELVPRLGVGGVAGELLEPGIPVGGDVTRSWPPITATTGSSGRFEIAGRSGECDALLVTSNSTRQRVSAQDWVVDGSLLHITLPPTLNLTGQLIDDKGKPLSRVHGECFAATFSCQFDTTTDGYFTAQIYCSEPRELPPLSLRVPGYLQSGELSMPEVSELKTSELSATRIASCDLGCVALSFDNALWVEVADQQGVVSSAEIRVGGADSPMALTDLDGRARVPLPPEMISSEPSRSIDLQVLAAGYVPWKQRLLLQKGAAAATVSVTLESGATINGSCLKPGAVAASGVEVLLRGAGVSRRVWSGPDGHYHIRGVPTGVPLQLSFSGGGVEPTVRWIDALQQGEEFHVAPQFLVAGSSIVGRVYQRNEHDQQMPLPGAMVRVVNADGESSAWGMSGADGSYTITGFDSRSRAAFCSHSSTCEILLEREPGDFVFSPTISWSSRVTEFDGTPARGVRVGYSAVAGAWGRSPFAWTDSQGWVTIDGIPRAAGELRFWKGEVLQLKQVFDFDSGFSRDTDLPQEIVLPRCFAARFELDGLPKRVSYRLYRANEAVAIGEVRDLPRVGNEVWIEGLAPGSYRWVLRSPQMPRLEYEFDVGSQNPLHRLQPAAIPPLQLKVVDINGAPILGATVRVREWIAGVGFVHEVPVDVHGEWRGWVSRVEVLEIGAPNYETIVVEEVEEYLRQHRGEVVLRRSGTLRIDVVDSRGRGMDGVRVSCRGMSSLGMPATLTSAARARSLHLPTPVSADGFVALEGLEQGRYQLAFSKEGRDLGETEVEIRVGEDQSLVYEVVSWGSLIGQIVIAVEPGEQLGTFSRAASGDEPSDESSDRFDLTGQLLATLWNGSPTHWLSVERDGTIRGEIPDAVRTLHYRSADSQWQGRWVVDRSATRDPLRLTLSVCRVAGTVCDAEGNPVSGLPVRIVGPVAYEVITDTDGRFALNRVPRGHYIAQIVRDLAGHPRRVFQNPVVLAQDPQSRCELTLVPPRRVTPAAPTVARKVVVERCLERGFAPVPITESGDLLLPRQPVDLCLYTRGWAPQFLHVDAHQTEIPPLDAVLDPAQLGGRLILTAATEQALVVGSSQPLPEHYRRHQLMPQQTLSLPLPVGDYQLHLDSGVHPVRVGAGSEVVLVVP